MCITFQQFFIHILFYYRYVLASAEHVVETEGADQAETRLQSHILNVNKVELSDRGNFTCFDHTKNITDIVFRLEPIIPPKIISKSDAVVRRNITGRAEFYCTFNLYPIETFERLMTWRLEEADRGEEADTSDYQRLSAMIKNNTEIKRLNNTMVKISLKINDINKKHNGTYVCEVDKPAHIDGDVTYDSFTTTLLVMDKPQLVIDFTKAVGESKIYMNWTINDGNDPVKNYRLDFLKEGDSARRYYHELIKGGNNSHVFTKFEKSTNYDLKLCAINRWGENCYDTKVRTLDKDPVFVPRVEVKGVSHSTITIGWAAPPQDLLDFIQYYKVKAYLPGKEKKFTEEAIHPQNSRNLPYMFDNLSTATEYSFQVKACSELTRQCGNWSEVVNGTTLDGLSSAPLNLRIKCEHFNISRRNKVELEWDPPSVPNGIIMSYQIELTGHSNYRLGKNYRNDTWGPKSRTVGATERKTTFEPVPPNTNYTIRVAGVTRSRRPGDFSEIKCTMPPTVPDYTGRLTWGKVKEDVGNWVFKLFLPRASERNGPICCYRIYLIRLGDPNLVNAGPEDMDVLSYEEVHALNNTRGGAYIAEILTADDFQPEILLGDGKQMETIKEDRASNVCRSCYENLRKKIARPKSTTTTVAPDYELDIEDVTTDLPQSPVVPPQARRRRRQAQPSIPNDFINLNNPSVMSLDPAVHDGRLNTDSNYTGFVEIIVENSQTQNSLSAYSEYFETMKAGAPNFPPNGDFDMEALLNIGVTVLCGLILIVLILLTTLCLLHRYYSKNAAQADEVYTLSDSLRAFCYGRSSSNQHRHLITSAPTKPPDMPPIAKIDLAEACRTRHKDSDYGFQEEFEMLPDRFTDRTTKNTDSKENLCKNRYPDIKSYDQTRVKLSMINSTIGSDYINANFVMGYKERKKFICTQGPMETTVNDFWRMIWEQHLEIIIMLTNLEEYNKTKCARYWPDKQDSAQFGEITVTYSLESKFSDYLIRELKVNYIHVTALRKNVTNFI